MKNLLLLEDDRTLCQGIALALQSDRLRITQCHSISEATRQLQSQKYHLAIFDINLPDGSGLDLLVQVRKTKQLPVLLLTAMDTEINIVNGLELGADDYITKPFSLAVLRARVSAQLRRLDPAPEQSYQQDMFRFDFDQMEFWKGQQQIELSRTEQKLLRQLIDHPGMTLTRGQLIDAIWTDERSYVDENALSVAIKRLRDKLEDNPKKPFYIHTIYGIGYMWKVNPC